MSYKQSFTSSGAPNGGEV